MVSILGYNRYMALKKELQLLFSPTGGATFGLDYFCEVWWWLNNTFYLFVHYTFLNDFANYDFIMIHKSSRQCWQCTGDLTAGVFIPVSQTSDRPVNSRMSSSLPTSLDCILQDCLGIRVQMILCYTRATLNSFL